MNEKEILALIIVMYDYDCKNKSETVCEVNGQKVSFIMLVHPANDYLKRKGYFSKKDNRPTLKMYKLLHKYNVRIKALEEAQNEYAKTKHITQIDKFGNIEIL